MYKKSDILTDYCVASDSMAGNYDEIQREDQQFLGPSVINNYNFFIFSSDDSPNFTRLLHYLSPGGLRPRSQPSHSLPGENTRGDRLKIQSNGENRRDQTQAQVDSWIRDQLSSTQSGQ